MALHKDVQACRLEVVLRIATGAASLGAVLAPAINPGMANTPTGAKGQMLQNPELQLQPQSRTSNSLRRSNNSLILKTPGTPRRSHLGCLGSWS